MYVYIISDTFDWKLIVLLFNTIDFCYDKKIIVIK